MTKKFKVIKDWPGSPPPSNIFTLGEEKTMYHNGLGFCFEKHDVEEKPEFFAPFLFTTEDGVDIYDRDNYYVVVESCNGLTICTKTEKWDSTKDCMTFYKDPYYKYFSTKEAAQNYIDSLKPKYEVGEWLYFSTIEGHGIFRYKQITMNSHDSDESYYIWKGIICQGGCFPITWNIAKSTPEQIQDILSKVAQHKGFKEGVKFKSVGMGYEEVVSKPIKYYKDIDGLNCPRSIYNKGKWAEIVEDAPEYVKCIDWIGYSHKVGTIYKVNNGMVDCETGYEGMLLPTPTEYSQFKDSHFIPSTKEAYDAQFNTKSVTITVDGDVVNTSHWGNNVNIVYK